MADRLKRVSFTRLAVVTAVLAFPLLAVGTAQAAVAGANPEVTSNRPDLLSATALNATNVDFCFDKVLNNVPFPAASFRLGGYRSGQVVTATSANLEQTVDTTGKCVRATYSPPPTTPAPPGIGDIGQYTVGTVLTGAVQTTAAIPNPNTDSTALTVPASLNPTHNGTAGFTVTPDLVGVLPDPTTNTITYTEDQAVDTTPAPVGPSFQFTRSGGTVCLGLAAPAPVVSGNTVTVFFGPVATCPVSDAQRAGQVAGALRAAADPTIPSTPDQAIVPASATSSGTGTTALPDLARPVVLSANGSTLDFTFDKSVSVTNPAAFNAILSNGTVVPSATAVVIATSTTSTTIRASFNLVVADLSQFDEYVVKASVNPGAVTETSPPTLVNQFDAAPAGDNAGAFARGFTTGPDVFSGIINTTTGALTLAVDQRVGAGIAGNIHLIDSTGVDVTPTGATSVTFPTQPAGPESITAQFSPGQASTAKNTVLFGAPAVTGALFTPAVLQPNVPQVLSITSTASIVHNAKLHKAQSKRFVAASRARTRAQEKALLAKLRHRMHKAHKHSKTH